MSHPILEIKNLQVEFTSENSSTKAVDDICLSVHQGEIVGVVGESGSGKSVTSLSAMGLIPQPPGKIISLSLIHI